MLTLYHFKGSPWCWKARIALAEKGIEHEAIVPENRESNPGFRKLTPIGKVPVLVLEDGTSVYESTIINEYLEDRYPTPPLMPNDPADKARARMIEEIADAYLAPALRRVFLARYRYEKGKIWRLPAVDTVAEEEGMREAAKYLDYLDREAEGQEYFLTQFSLADIGLIPPLTRTARFLDLPLQQKWPSLASWVERVLSRPSVSSTAPPPYVIEEGTA